MDTYDAPRIRAAELFALQIAMRTLAKNLAIAGALCSAWTQGTHSMMAKLWNHDAWEPGCGRSIEP